MARAFNFYFEGRLLSVRPIVVDEGWELWVMEGNKRLACGARLSVDEVIAAGRAGQDCIQQAAKAIEQRISTEGLYPDIGPF